MKKILAILTATLFITLTAKGQNLFFIGEKSYPCTETITLQSNSDNGDDLNVLFAKDKVIAFFVVSKESPFFKSTFGEKLIIYLDDGKVITCIDRAKHDFVDNKTLAVYNLTNEQLSKMKNSNINTVRYGLKFDLGSLSPEEKYFTASNKGDRTKTDFPALLTDLMDRTKNALANSRNTGSNPTSEGVAGGSGNQGVLTGSVDSKVRGAGVGIGSSGISYDLSGRGFQKLPPPKYDYQGEGRVVVEISVDRDGRVILAIPGTKGSTTLDEYLLKVAKDAAMEARFEAKPDAPAIQKGTITYNFILK